MNKNRILFVFILGSFLFSLISPRNGSTFVINGWSPYGWAPYGPNPVPNFLPNYLASGFYTNPAVAYNPFFRNNLGTATFSNNSVPGTYNGTSSNPVALIFYNGPSAIRVPGTYYNGTWVPEPSGDKMKTINQADNGKTLTFQVGDRVILTLPSDYTLSNPNPPSPVPGMVWSSAWDPVQTGTQWKEDLDLLDWSVFRTFTLDQDGTNQTFIYDAMKAGETELVLTRGDITFSVSIIVE